MTTYLGKSCSFCLPRVPLVNCRQFMYLVISLLVLRAGYGICLYQFLIIAYLFTLSFRWAHMPFCLFVFLSFFFFLDAMYICSNKAGSFFEAVYFFLSFFPSFFLLIKIME